MLILNENTVHFIDNIFRNIGFKTETHAERLFFSLLVIFLIVFIIFQFCVKVGLARVAGQMCCHRPNQDQFRPALTPECWMAFMNYFLARFVDAGPAHGHAPLIVEDDA
jgi:hypothetical protein